MMFFVFPGAEHSRFSHALGAMELAGRLYDALAAKGAGLLDPDRRARERRLVRAAGLLHDVGHAPFSHSAEEQFEGGIDHEEMTRRLLDLPEVREAFAAPRRRHARRPTWRACSRGGEGRSSGCCRRWSPASSTSTRWTTCCATASSAACATAATTCRGCSTPCCRSATPTDAAEWGIGVEEGGVHALEALVMARYYMFTQVYFNVTGKALELHLSAWLAEEGTPLVGRSRGVPRRGRRGGAGRACARRSSPHARAVLRPRPLPARLRDPRAPDARADASASRRSCRRSSSASGAGNLLVSNSAKDPHRLGESRVFVQRYDGTLEPVEEASQFIRHLTRIESFRVYAAPQRCGDVKAAIGELWE